MFVLQEISILTYWIIASIKECKTILAQLYSSNKQTYQG